MEPQFFRILQKAGPFIGPRGGLWADPQHTIPYRKTLPKHTKPHEPKPDDPVFKEYRHREARHWVRAMDMGYSPTDKMYHEHGGIYKAERRALHRKIIDSFVSKVPSVPASHKPTAVVMMGGPAAGKGTLLKHIMAGKEKELVNVNPDEVKKQLPEYRELTGGLGTDPESGKQISAVDASFLTHKESSMVATEVFDSAINNRQNLMLDGTGKDLNKFLPQIRKLRKAGYHVLLAMPHITSMDAQQRAINRAESKGRYVPENIVDIAHALIPGNFRAVASQADEFVLFDNNKPPPRPVLSGARGQSDTVHDPAYMVEFFKYAKAKQDYAREKGWIKSWVYGDLQKSAGKPSAITLADILERVKTNRGEGDEYSTGLDELWDEWESALNLSKSLHMLPLIKGGPYIGPHGGKWADPQHTIPYGYKGQTGGSEHVQALQNHLKDLHSIKLSLTHHNGRTTLRNMVVPKEQRGRGIGNAVMEAVKRHADKHDHQIALTSDPSLGGSGGSKARLKKWYKKHDFVENKGRNRDFEISEDMYRNPKSLKKSEPDKTKKTGGRKLHDQIKFRGLNISIENRAGSIREWYDPDKQEHGQTLMSVPYGYVRGSLGQDGDHVDVYVGPNEFASSVYVINQLKRPEFVQFDEQKCMLGFDSPQEAKATYLSHYDDERFFGTMQTMPFEEFKAKVLATNGRNRLVRAFRIRGMEKSSAKDKRFSEATVRQIAQKLGVDWGKVDWTLKDLTVGMEIELEHQDVTKGDPTKTAKIAIAHLKERSDYYKLLVEMEKKPLKKAEGGGPYIGPRGGLWADPQHTIPYKKPTQKKPVQMGLFEEREKPTPEKKDQRKIKKILSVVDTREYEEVNDRYRPIPGTGELSICDRCGRGHEVHATVLLESGQTSVVGTGCMRAESTEVQSKVKSLTSASKTLARLRAEEKDLKAVLENNQRIRHEVDQLPVPEIKVKHEPDELSDEMTIIYVGDVEMHTWKHKDIPHNTKMAVHSWQDKRYKEMGGTRDTSYDLEDLQYRISKMEKKVNKLLGKSLVGTFKLIKGGKYYGPRGGVYADPQHKIPYKEYKEPQQIGLFGEVEKPKMLVPKIKEDPSAREQWKAGRKHAEDAYQRLRDKVERGIIPGFPKNPTPTDVRKLLRYLEAGLPGTGVTAHPVIQSKYGKQILQQLIQNRGKLR